MKFVLDNTVFSNFAAVSQIRLIKKALIKVFTTVEIYEEILDGITKGYEFLRDIEKAMSYEGKQGWIT